jgi:acyl transferase domain-containing protein/NAD(P)-dependent dehydrogenase (short-subunit alcohol dehydrogenase family)/NAD(P)H-dependent flavin oxidoreductase YrpB (nitropropane dioxygenase family)/predicted hotdog family 3-hydroxylacyl-ACP dehydratase
MQTFRKFILTPAGSQDIALAVAATRCGGIGIVNQELGCDRAAWQTQLDALARLKGDGEFGLKLRRVDAAAGTDLASRVDGGLRWLIVDADQAAADRSVLQALRGAGLQVCAEVLTAAWPEGLCEGDVDALMLKGNECGGFVGEDASFILMQKWHARSQLPLFVRGGMTPQVAAACHAVGIAGGALDSQLLLLEEAQPTETARAVIASLSGSETVTVGDGERGEYFRILSRPGHAAAKAFQAEGEGLGYAGLRERVAGKLDWCNPRNGLLPVGQDVCFAAAWRQRYQSLGALLAAFDEAVAKASAIVAAEPPVREQSPLAQALGTRLPIVQGPMTRVSDVPAFAAAVSAGGALPMIALALLRGDALEQVLLGTAELMGNRPWGIGLLGFAPQALLDEQLAMALRFAPRYAIIAGGRPDQAVSLEAAGVRCFLHVPSANLVPLFVQDGARRFIFEGRECGGHIGPLSSFVLWSSMVDRLGDEIDARRVPAAELELLFAGGIHDAVSSAMVQVLAAPLVARGVKVGILMGSAYLFTSEIVDSGAIVERFQQAVIACEHTVSLESGPGHASRCAYTPFAHEFFTKRAQVRRDKVPADEGRQVLDDLILGRLRIASKGRTRSGEGGALQTLDPARQYAEGMYMLGQAATLRNEVTGIERLHRDVSLDAAALLAALAQGQDGPDDPVPGEPPADIAIVGLGGLLPKANSPAEFWDNILANVDAITEIPSHRWDWRLYFDSDREAKDKIYSKWGGFLDDLPFDPMRYGMPPKSIEAVDPMQLMALEVAQRTLADAGYDRRAFDRERASVIIGASGGTGDVGTQYALRAELPRFAGALPSEVASRLPEWTEDSFAGILLNVIAGRVANRLNFGGVNFTTDAACASSLAAVYQGVSELVAGRSDLVIAGGVDTVQGPFGYLCFSKTQALSPRGRCSTFDETSDGIVISEGIAMVALKRLADAERDGDRVYAVIKGVGGSSDGSAKGMTAPLPAGQVRAMRRAYRMAGFGPATVGLFEAHGTGTVAGDTAELQSTTQLIEADGGRARGSVIGSVKTMVGHTKATAGVAGLIKAVLALHHRVLPPHLGVKSPNPILARAEAPLYLLPQAMPWLSEREPRRAAVSAFGFGGTNFHVVLEEYTREYRRSLRPAPTRRWPAELLLWSAPDKDVLLARLQRLAAALPKIGELAMRDLAASLAAGWRDDVERLAVVAADPAALAEKIDGAIRFLRGETKALPAGVHHASGKPAPGKLAVLFPGQGSQFVGMVREAAVHLAPVAGALEEADLHLAEAFGERFGRRLSEFVFPRGNYTAAAQAAAAQALTSTDVAQPALGAVETGLFRFLRGLGLAPDMLAGHSYGEFVALHAAGVIDFAALMALSAARGRLIVDAVRDGGSELGTMAAVLALRKDVEEAIADIDDVVIANHNAPMQSVISGTCSGVAQALARLAAAGIEAQELPVAAAFHSQLVRPAQRALAQAIEATDWLPAALPVYANSTARPHPGDATRSRRLMADHLVQPVEFVSQIEAMYADGARVFVEVGPKSVLARLASKILAGRPHRAIAVDDGSGLPGLLGAIGDLLCTGVAIDPTSLFKGRDARIVDPDDWARLDRRVEPSRTTWMLNGSGARPASAAPRQIGVTLQQLAATPAPASALLGATVAPPTAAPMASPLAAPGPGFLNGRLAVKGAVAAVNSPTPPKKASPMDDRPPPLPAAADAVMSEYFETMRQFLETQDRVMAAFLGQAPMGRPALRARPLSSLPRVAAPTLPSPPAFAPIATPIAAPIAAPIATPIAPTAVPATAAVAPPPVAVGAPAVAAAAPAPVPPVSSDGARWSRDKIIEQLLAIVEAKTGYPKDMVGLEQNLEADLGVDSIKRIEVVGALLQALPEPYRAALNGSRKQLNTQPTLNGIVDLVIQAPAAGGVAVPFDSAGMGAQAAASSGHPSRHVIQAVTEPLEHDPSAALPRGSYVIAGGASPVGAALVRRLRAAGCTVETIALATLADEPALLAWCASRRESPLAGLVHLGALEQAVMSDEDGIGVWRAQLQLGDRSLFLLLRELGTALGEGARVLAATSLGGCFGRNAGPPTLRLQGGATGLLKSLAEERPELRLKAVDLDAAVTPELAAEALWRELALDGGRLEVGYPGGLRTIFRTVAAATPARAEAAWLAGPLVVLATGGARGITAEVLRELARPGAVLVLTGRSPWPEPEAEALSAIMAPAALRQHLIAQARSAAVPTRPAAIERQLQQILAAREMRANRDDFSRAGATVEYHAVDVTEGEQMQALIEGIYQRHGRIDGVVHGAGIIEDRLLAQKSGESWSRVVETKVFGLLWLARHVRPETLRFFTVFSSVAGRYGNSGQSDYATANELMNRVCEHLRARWGGRVAIAALCWGPWGATKFGVGMVTAETEAKFAAKGVLLVDAESGRRLFRDELDRPASASAELVCGAGPWEAREAALAVLHTAASAALPELGPLIGPSRVVADAQGRQRVAVQLDARHRYLADHVFDGRAVLPAAAALELMAEAAAAHWPAWKVVEVREHRLLKGVELAPGSNAKLSVLIEPATYGSSEGFEVGTSLQSDASEGPMRTHYRALVRLEHRLPPPVQHRPARYAASPVSAATAYTDWLSHGPLLQMVQEIVGLSDTGLLARVRSSQCTEWMADTGKGVWCFDPALLDAAAQMVWAWARAKRDETALPVRFGRVVRHDLTCPEWLNMELIVTPATEPSLVRAEVVFFDDAGQVLMMIDELESVASAALNRLGGGARSAMEA